MSPFKSDYENKRVKLVTGKRNKELVESFVNLRVIIEPEVGNLIC